MRPVVIFDIEASCEDRAINPYYNMETIEIGAVKVINNRVSEEFQILIEPEYIQSLTPFCEELTGITFADLKGKPKFTKAIIEFHNFIKNCDIYSCGDFDRKFLTKELEEKGKTYEHGLIKNTINSYHRDLKKNYTKFTNKKKAGMVGMARELGIVLEGEHHRGLDDSKNLAKIYIELEKIREKNLKIVFNDKTMEKLTEAINVHHSEIYEVKKHEDIYYTFDKLNGINNKHSFLNFIDLWSKVIPIDIEHRNLGYLTADQLQILKKYTL